MAKTPRLDSKGKALPDGVYENRNVLGQYYVVYDGPRHPDGRRNPKTEYSDADTGDRWTSSRKAAQYRSKQIQKVKEKNYIEPSKMTLREYLESWIEERSVNAKVNTLRSYRNALKVFLDSPLASTHLTNLTAKPLQTLLMNKIKEGLSPSSARSYLTKLKTALDDACTLKMISDNPAKLVKLVKPKKTKIIILSPQQVNEFLAFIQTNKHHDLAALAFSSGARRGELLGLREKDCDFENNTITFDQQVVQGENGPTIQDELKTEASKRTISITPDIMQLLKRQIRLRAKEKLRAGTSYINHGLVFAHPDGSPLDPKSVSTWFIRAGQRFGHPEFSLHVTRHTHASLLLLSGTPILTVSKRLGHSSVSMTLNVYGHLLPDTDRSAAEKLAEILGKGAV